MVDHVVVSDGAATNILGRLQVLERHEKQLAEDVQRLAGVTRGQTATLEAHTKSIDAQRDRVTMLEDAQAAFHQERRFYANARGADVGTLVHNPDTDRKFTYDAVYNKGVDDLVTTLRDMLDTPSMESVRLIIANAAHSVKGYRRAVRR